MQAESSAPAPLWTIAVLAMAPFPISAGFYVLTSGKSSQGGLSTLIVWSVVVLAFVGGIRWGLETWRSQPRWTRLAASIVSPVFASLLLLGRDQLGSGWVLGGFLAAFLLQWLFDHTAPDVPSRWPTLLTAVTLGAGLSLSVALEQALRM